MALTETSPDDVAPATDAELPAPPPPSLGTGAAGNDHKTVGTAFIALALVALVAGGVVAIVLRAQLAGPDGDILTDRQYRTLLTYHGTILVFLFLIPAWVGIATAIVPLQIGASRLAFPRLQTMTFWLALVGTGLVVGSAFAPGGKGLVTGWAFDAPIPERLTVRGDAIEFLLLGLVVVLVAAVLAMANLVTTVVQLRAKGLTTWRLPLFSWSILVSGIVILLAAPVVVAALGLLYADHHYGSRFFGGLTSSGAGNPLLWPRLFWFGAYPLLWALLLPVLGLAAEVVAVSAGRPLAEHRRTMVAVAAVGVLGFFGWGSEVRNLPRGQLLFALGALAVLAATAAVLLNILVTLRTAAQERGAEAVRDGLATSPMILIGGALLVLAAGLAAGAVSAVDATGISHSSYWSVGQMHLLYFLPATIAVVAGVHYWGPKVWGRHLSPTMARVEALLLVGGGFLSFLPALWLGAQDMRTQTSTYTSHEGWGLGNLAMSVGAAVIGLGALVFVLDLLITIAAHKGRPADADPWDGHTLEWTAPSPAPRHNFDQLPDVRSPHPALDLREAGGD
ncbi:MAG: cbb3-type cytochrome c oxidase subunit I [Acidimicrobiales bacterium]